MGPIRDISQRRAIEVREERWLEMRPAGFEPATHSLEGCCSIQLSYGRQTVDNNLRAGVSGEDSGAAGSFEPHPENLQPPV